MTVSRVHSSSQLTRDLGTGGLARASGRGFLASHGPPTMTRTLTLTRTANIDLGR